MRLKYVIATAANYIPALCACLFFRGGGPVMFPLLIALQIILTLLNFFIANSKKPMIFLSANLLVSTIIANVLSTYLYYTNMAMTTHATDLLPRRIKSTLFTMSRYSASVFTKMHISSALR